MLLIRVPLWLAETNAYIVAAEGGGPAILVDAPPDPGPIVDLLLEHDLALAGVLLTHGHIDHTGGSGHVAGETGAAVYVHPDDDFLTLTTRDDQHSDLQSPVVREGNRRSANAGIINAPRPGAKGLS